MNLLLGCGRGRGTGTPPVDAPALAQAYYDTTADGAAWATIDQDITAAEAGVLGFLRDQSPYGRHLSASGSQRPTFAAGVATFDGVDDGLSCDGVTLAGGDFAMIAVVRRNWKVDSYRAFWGLGFANSSGYGAMQAGSDVPAYWGVGQLVMAGGTGFGPGNPGRVLSLPLGSHSNGERLLIMCRVGRDVRINGASDNGEVIAGGGDSVTDTLWLGTNGTPGNEWDDQVELLGLFTGVGDATLDSIYAQVAAAKGFTP